MLSRLLLALAAAVVLSTTVTAVPSPAAAPGQTQRYLAAVRAATNDERTERRLPALRGDRCLQRVARAQALRMARERRLSHTEPFGAVLRRCDLATAGENVAAHPGSGRAVVRAWMGSEGHRANILGRQYRLLGVAAVRRHGTWWTVQVFGRR